MATVTRADLANAVHRETDLARRDAAALVDMAIETIAERLSAGETVTISGFGSFRVRDKRAREGRNPKTGEPAPIPARRVVTFRASHVLKTRIAEGRADAGNETWAVGSGAAIGIGSRSIDSFSRRSRKRNRDDRIR